MDISFKPITIKSIRMNYSLKVVTYIIIVFILVIICNFVKTSLLNWQYCERCVKFSTYINLNLASFWAMYPNSNQLWWGYETKAMREVARFYSPDTPSPNISVASLESVSVNEVETARKLIKQQRPWLMVYGVNDYTDSLNLMAKRLEDSVGW
jgi:hypothetical protein